MIGGENMCCQHVGEVFIMTTRDPERTDRVVSLFLLLDVRCSVAREAPSRKKRASGRSPSSSSPVYVGVVLSEE
jgi:hypothetical protein